MTFASRLALASAAFAALVDPAAAQLPTHALVTSGMAAPGGGAFANVATAPAVNNAGPVAFVAFLSGTDPALGTFRAGGPGGEVVAASGGVPPPGSINYGFNRPAINAGGDVGFFSGVSGGGAGSGLFRFTSGSATGPVPVALVGGAASGGGTYAGFRFTPIYTPTFNAAGQIAFGATVTGGPAAEGIFRADGQSATAVALTGTPAPGGGTYSGLAVAGPSPGLNDTGQVAFRATLTGGSSGEGLFLAATDGTTTAVARAGAAAPGGGTFTGFSGPKLNNAGQVLFVAGLSGTAATSGLFRSTGATTVALARRGDAAPGGGTYAGFDEPAHNDAGRVAFRAVLSGGGSAEAIVRTDGGAATVVARAGTAAPGTDVTFSGFNTPRLSDSGFVLIRGVLTGPGVTTGNQIGLWAGTTEGDLKLVARDGTAVVVDGVTRTVRGIEGWDISDAGVAWTAEFTDGSSAVMLTPVPEPAAVILVAAVGAAAVARLRRSPSVRRRVRWPTSS